MRDINEGVKRPKEGKNLPPCSEASQRPRSDVHIIEMLRSLGDLISFNDDVFGKRSERGK